MITLLNNIFLLFYLFNLKNQFTNDHCGSVTLGTAQNAGK